jgi:hypothetical protein
VPKIRPSCHRSSCRTAGGRGSVPRGRASPLPWTSNSRLPERVGTPVAPPSVAKKHRHRRCCLPCNSRAGGHVQRRRRTPPFVHASERRRVQASDARPGTSRRRRRRCSHRDWQRERRWRRRPGFDSSLRRHEAITSRRCMHTQPVAQFASDVEHVAGEGRAIPRIERCGCGHEAAIANASPRASDWLNGSGGQAIRSRNSRALSTSRSPMSASSTSRSLETSTALVALARATR